MKITEEHIRRITISEIHGLDPIRVMLEDTGPGQGRINIECYGQSWATYWGSMGKDNKLSDFFCSCDEHYIAGKLRGGLRPDVFDPDHLKESLKAQVFKDRRNGWLSKREARAKFNTIDELDLPESEEQLWGIAKQMTEIAGDEWWYNLPKKPNPDYLYLTRIIKAVQMALMLEQHT